jgi:hypothetical protein
MAGFYLAPARGLRRIQDITTTAWRGTFAATQRNLPLFLLTAFAITATPQTGYAKFVELSLLHALAGVALPGLAAGLASVLFRKFGGVPVQSQATS